MAQQWYVCFDGEKKLGPFSAAELQAFASTGNLAPSDMVWHEGMSQWQPADKVKGLFASAEPAPTAGRPMTPAPPVPAAYREACRRELSHGAAKPPTRPATGHEAAAPAPLPQPHVSPNPPSVLAVRPVTGTKKLLVWLSAGSLACVVMCSGILYAIGSKAKAKTEAQAKKADEARALPDSLSVANGRIPIRTFLDYIKRKESLEMSTPPEGSDIDGTPFEFLNKELGEPCRIHVGGRDFSTQRVSAIFVETTSDQKLAVAILATPFDVKAGPRFGNDITSLGTFVRSMLPECNLREIFKTQSAKLATGGTATVVHGKATVSVVYDKGKKELRATITIVP